MQALPHPIWKTDLENEWGLYYRTDYKLPVIADPKQKEKEKDKGKAKSKVQQNATDSPFFFSKVKQEVKGTTICTPKGYGIIQTIDQNTISVKVQGVIHEFDKKEVMTEVPLNMIYLKDVTKVEEILYLPVNSTIQDLIDKIENSLTEKQDSDKVMNVKLFFQGKELEKSDDTLEKMKITPYSKFLVTNSAGKAYCIKRFNYANQGWCVASGMNADGIAFQVNKSIRLSGIGMYPVSNKEGATAVLKIIAGDSYKGEVLHSEDVEVTKNPGEGDSQPCKVMMRRPVSIKADEFYSIAITFSQTGNSYYGSGGQLKMQGDGDVSFTFKNCNGANNGTGTSSGQIPEIYYYA